MKKTLISLEPEDRAWLEQFSYQNKQSLSESVRQAVRALRAQHKTSQHLNVLAMTAGVWKDRVQDGLELQNKLRAEWDRPYNE